MRLSLSADRSRTLLRLVVPVVSHMLLTRYAGQQTGVYEIAVYLRDDLSGRVPGGLHWEARKAQRVQHSAPPLRWLIDPKILFFPEPSAVVGGSADRSQWMGASGESMARQLGSQWRGSPGPW